MKSKYVRKDSAIFELGVKRLRATVDFNQAWPAFWEHLPVLKNKRFRELLPLFIREVHDFCLSYRRSDGIDSAAGEFFRKTITTESQPLGYCFDDALLFAKTYSKVKRRLASSLGRLFDFHGDSFEDCIDSLPLAGPAFLKWLKTAHVDFKSDEDVKNALREFSEKNCGEYSPKLMRNLLLGENYVESALRNHAESCWLYVVSAQLRTDKAKARAAD